MAKKGDKWSYVDETGQEVGPVTKADIDHLHAEGKFDERITRFFNLDRRFRGGAGMPGPAQGLLYSQISWLDVEFAPTVEEFQAARKDKAITVLSGPNNQGKTLLLKQLFYLVGHDGYLVECNRFSTIDVLNTRQQDANESDRYFDAFLTKYYTSRANTEDNQLKLEQIITGLEDEQARKLFMVAEELLGNKFDVKHVDNSKRFSPYYVDMDGENLRYGSSGTRLLLTLLGILFDKRFPVILIDEPEIGLSPRIQAVLARFLYDQDRRLDFFPHLRQIYIATHSHLFLDRIVLQNNHIVTKSGNKVSVKQVQSTSDLHQLQFNLLGNDLESIFLPSAILIVEGDSDVTFMNKVHQLHIPDRNVAVVCSHGDDALGKLHVLIEAFGKIEESPYRERLFVVLDQKQSVKLHRVQKLGLPEENVTVWKGNGIEYLYPKKLVANAFRCDESDLAHADLESDPIVIGEASKSKKELAQFVAERMTTADAMHPELARLIDRIKEVCK